MTDLEALAKLAAEATPGPWRWVETYDWPGQTEGDLLTDAPGGGLYSTPPLVIEATGYETEGVRMKTADAAYIASASPDVVLALVRVALAAKESLALDAIAAHRLIRAALWDLR